MSTNMIATLILPLLGNDGVLLTDQRARVEDLLLLHFSGYYCVDSTGADLDGEGKPRRERSKVYTIAFTDSEQAYVAFQSIACAFQRDARQDSVYLAFAPALIELVS